MSGLRSGLRLCRRLPLSPLRRLAFGRPAAAGAMWERSERAAARLRHISCSLTPAQAAAALSKPKESAAGYCLPPPEIATSESPAGSGWVGRLLRALPLRRALPLQGAAVGEKASIMKQGPF